MGIGSFYSAKGVIVGQAMGLYAPENTPLPADGIELFDEASWASTAVTVGAASAGTFTLSMAGGPLLETGVVTTAALDFDSSAVEVAAGITAALNAAGIFSLTPVVTGTGPAVTPWVIAFVGPAGSQVVVTGVGTGLTGGGFLATPPAWTPAGATEQGWQNNYNPTTQDITIEEQQTTVGRNITTATFDFVANLSEDSVANLALAMSGARTITAADTDTYGSDEMTLQEDLPVLAVALETKSRLGFPRRYYVPGATVASNVGQQFARARGQRLIPVTFTSVCDQSAIKIREITADLTP